MQSRGPPMTNPDLAALSEAATQEALSEEGRYFSDTLCDLASCAHGDTGEFNHRADGPFIAALWNAYRAGNLVQIDREGMRERVARAIDHELVWSVETDVLAASLTREEQLKVADAAIAAILGGE